MRSSASSSGGSRRGSSSDGVRVKPRAAACDSGIELVCQSACASSGSGDRRPAPADRRRDEPREDASRACQLQPDGDSSTISAAKMTAQTGWNVSRIEVVTAGSRGSDVEISSQPRTWDDSASRISQTDRCPGRRQVEVADEGADRGAADRRCERRREERAGRRRRSRLPWRSASRKPEYAMPVSTP